jgi:hypothetical protein
VRNGRQKRGTPAKRRRSATKPILSTEFERIIRERERLLQAAGAAAALFSKLNIRDFPSEAREPVRRLGAVLDTLSEETLTDAIALLVGRSSLGALAGTAR